MIDNLNSSNVPSANRCHIGFFGRTNAGKSSLINAITNQEVSIVSDIKGTTTDIVKKAMEILPLGPVMLIDTAGIDDDSQLGLLRVEKTLKTIDKINIAIIVVDINIGLTNSENDLINIFKNKKIPYLIVYNKSDLINNYPNIKENEIIVSTKTNYNIENLKEKIAHLHKYKEKYIIKDKLSKNDFVVLSIPIDESAPKGRLILPQQLVIKEILDSNAICICTQDTELKETIDNLSKKPKIIITDSQVFNKVKDIVPDDMLLTSFSILFANFKGNLETLVNGVKKINTLNDNDTILISEGCTHHRQCNDIGSVKLPNWIKNYTNKNLNFEYSSGENFPDNLSKYSLIIHCGGCMLNEATMQFRIKSSKNQNIPITNYGITIAYINGILKRSLEIFPEICNII